MTAYHNRRKYRLRIVYFLLFAIILPVTCMGAGGIMAAENVCEKLLPKETSVTLSRGQIKHLQESLEAMGYAPEKIDGIMGPLTRAALKQYCDEFEKEFRKESIDEFIAKLALYAAIAGDYPQWKEIVKNEEFKLWIDQQPVGEKVAYHIIMRTWTAKDIISLFDQYKSDQKKSGSGEKKQNIVSYKLTKSDLAGLQAEMDIAGELAELKGKSYDDKEDFIKAVQEVLGMQKSEFEGYEDLIIESAQKDLYTLTEKSFIALKEAIPGSMVDDLKKIKDKEFQGTDTFKTEIEAIIEKAIQFDQYQPLVLKYAKVDGPYRISKEYLEKLKKKNVPDDVIAQLKTLPREPYPDINAFKKAVRPIIEDVTIEDNFPDPVISELSGLREEVPEKQREGADKIIRQERVNYINYQKIIIQEIDELPLYKLTDQSRKKLEKEGVPTYIVKKLNELKGKGYSSENLFKQALTIENKKLVESYEVAVVKQAEKTSTYQLTKRSLKDLKKNLKATTIPDTVMAKLQRLQDMGYANEALFLNALAVHTCEISQYESLLKDIKYESKDQYIDDLKDTTCETFQYRTLIVDKAKKEHSFEKIKETSIKWAAKSCNCVLDDLSGVVYGFYPFWMAADTADQGKKEKPGEKINGEAAKKNNQKQQLVDFSVLSRIGYYALSFDENGDIYGQLPWEPLPNEKEAGKKAAEFLRLARQYETSLDLVIYQNDWEKWIQMIPEQKSLIFKKLRKNIVKLLHVKLTDSFSLIKPYISFGQSPVPTVADGVTLFFDGYPEDDVSKDLFVDFFKELRNNLKEIGKNYYLNIMLPRDAIGKGAYDFETLKHLIPKTGEGEQGYEDQKIVNHFLVFIEEPTTETKKTLREDVEKLFTGVQRRTMLRKIIPIITPIIAGTEQNEQQRKDDLKQLEDDLIYFDDNFGGVGFWTLPINEGSGVNLRTCLWELWPWYKTQAEDHATLADDVNIHIAEFYQKEDAKLISPYQNFLILHRWIFRIVFNILALILLVCVVLFKFNCWFRVLFWKHLWLFVIGFGLFVCNLFALLYWDPSWKSWSEGNAILFLVIIGITVFAIFAFVKKSRQRELP